jgi:hypothetical protein
MLTDYLTSSLRIKLLHKIDKFFIALYTGLYNYCESLKATTKSDIRVWLKLIGDKFRHQQKKLKLCIKI